MTELGNNCYCYKDECNQKEWEKQGREGKRKWTVVSSYWFRGPLFGNKMNHPIYLCQSE